MHNVFLVGPMGAGKSTIGRVLANALKFSFYDSDNIIESRAGVDISWIFDLEGEKGFRVREQRVIEELTQKNNIVLATGGGTVIIPENRAALAAKGTVVYLRTSLKQQLERTRRDTKRPLLQTGDVDKQLKKLWDEREPFYRELADFCFDTDKLTVKVIVNQIVKSI